MEEFSRPSRGSGLRPTALADPNKQQSRRHQLATAEIIQRASQM
jgi:hypothetical protein